jgi:hypothetical protein
MNLNFTLSHGFAPAGTSIGLGVATHVGKCGCFILETTLLFVKAEFTFESKACRERKAKAAQSRPPQRALDTDDGA